MHQYQNQTNSSPLSRYFIFLIMKKFIQIVFVVFISSTAFCQNIAKGKIKNTQCQTYITKGDFLSKSSRFSEAIIEYTNAININPNSIDAYYGRAIAQYYSLRFEDSKRDLDFVIAHVPSCDYSYYDLRSRARVGFHDYQGALEDINKALAMNKALDNYLQRASVYLNLGDDKKAIEDFNYVIDNAKEDRLKMAAYWGLGNYYSFSEYKVRDYLKGINNYKKALEFADHEYGYLYKRIVWSYTMMIKDKMYFSLTQNEIQEEGCKWLKLLKDKYAEEINSKEGDIYKDFDFFNTTLKCK